MPLSVPRAPAPRNSSATYLQSHKRSACRDARGGLERTGLMHTRLAALFNRAAGYFTPCTQCKRRTNENRGDKWKITLNIWLHLQHNERRKSNGSASTSQAKNASISTMRTKDWEEKYAYDGCVDLWVEEEFNAGSRLSVGDVYLLYSDFFDPAHNFRTCCNGMQQSGDNL